MRALFYILGCALAGFMAPAGAFAQLSASAQIRTRTELLQGQGVPLASGEKASFFTSQRTRLQIGYIGYRTKVWVAVQDVRVWGQDASTNNRATNAAQNGLMLHEAWGEISLLDTVKTNKGIEFALKIGRQELMYDDSRLLGNLDWLQQARRHDAALLKYGKNGFSAHLGLAYNQNREIRNGTTYDGIPSGYAAGTNGIGTMYKSMQFLYLGKRLKLGNISFLALKDDFQKYIISSTGIKALQKGTWNRLTSGFYFQAKPSSSLNLTLSAYGQNGRDKDGNKLASYLYSAKAVYDLSKNFSVGPGFDYTSGTRSGSEKNNSFDPLYGTPHKFWGQMDYFYVANGFGKGGLQDLFLTTSTKLSNKLILQADLHHFNSASQIRNARDEKISGNLGDELDIIANFNLTKTISFQAGYCTFFTTASLSEIKGVKNPQKMANWAYLMINIKPDFLK
jgi:hypothetical protein